MTPTTGRLLKHLALAALAGTMLAGCQDPNASYVYNPRTGAYQRVATPARVATNPNSDAAIRSRAPYRLEEFQPQPRRAATRAPAPGQAAAPAPRATGTAANDGGGGDSGGGSGGGGGGSGGGGGGSGGGGGGSGGGGGGGGGSGGGGGGGGGWSDIRLKRNIERVGTTPQGFGLYAFDYVWGGPRQVGVMAQEVLRRHPEAVILTGSGYYKVDYARLGLEMRSFAAWNAARATMDTVH